MASKHSNNQRFKKIVDERFTLSRARGGGAIRIEAWQDSNGQTIKYSIAYINHALFQHDNGRVLCYDNAHNYHHRHCFGEIEAVNDFISYEDLLTRFQNEIKKYTS